MRGDTESVFAVLMYTYSAEKTDFRNHLAELLQLSTEAVTELCTRALDNEENHLELLMLKVMHRPIGSYYTIS